MKRALTSALLLGMVGWGVAGSLASVARAADEKCQVATKGDSPTAQACAKGGRPEATKVMKAMVKTAKANGVVFKCDGCHEDMDTYKLKSDAKDDYKKLLAAQEKKK